MFDPLVTNDEPLGVVKKKTPNRGDKILETPQLLYTVERNLPRTPHDNIQEVD